MIVHFENGRLGNQLFQYLGFRHYFPGEKLLVFGCDELRDNFRNIDCRFARLSPRLLWQPLNRNLSLRFVQRLALLLVDLKILGTLREDASSAEFTLKRRKGLIPHVYVPRNISFQHSDLIEAIGSVPEIDPSINEQAQCWLTSRNIKAGDSNLVFVHVRRGDYLHWPSREFPAVLPYEWYARSTNRLRAEINNPVFVIMSDDLHYLRDLFTESETLLISDNAAVVDLAIMSRCHSGILSASSFAWWGAFYARRNDKEDAVFLAPECWAGHRSGQFYPPFFRTHWLTYC